MILRGSEEKLQLPPAYRCRMVCQQAPGHESASPFPSPFVSVADPPALYSALVLPSPANVLAKPTPFRLPEIARSGSLRQRCPSLLQTLASLRARTRPCSSFPLGAFCWRSPRCGMPTNRRLPFPSTCHSPAPLETCGSDWIPRPPSFEGEGIPMHILIALPSPTHPFGLFQDRSVSRPFVALPCQWKCGGTRLPSSQPTAGGPRAIPCLAESR
jgi:hypothetical protein